MTTIFQYLYDQPGVSNPQEEPVSDLDSAAAQLNRKNIDLTEAAAIIRAMEEHQLVTLCERRNSSSAMKAMGTEACRILRHLVRNGSWQQSKRSGESTVFRLKEPTKKAEPTRWMISRPFEFPADRVFALLRSSSARTEWDDGTVSHNVIETLDEDVDIVHTVSAAVFKGLVSSREFITLRCREVDSKTGVVVEAGMSVNYELPPEIKTTGVRATVYPGCGAVIEPTGDDSCLLHYVVKSSLGGRIPSWVIDKVFASELVRFFETFDKCLRTTDLPAEYQES